MVDKITVEKISAFGFVPRPEAMAKKPLYLAITSCGTKETITWFYQFPKFDKEKFSVKTEGSQEAQYAISPTGHSMIIW